MSVRVGVHVFARESTCVRQLSEGAPTATRKQSESVN